MNLFCSYNEHMRHVQVKISNCQLAVLYWGNENGILSDYLPVKILPLDANGEGAYTFPYNMLIPQETTRLIALADNRQEESVCCEIHSNDATETNPKLIFYAVSDTHLVTKNAKCQRNLRDAWQMIAQAHPAFVLHAGDITNGAQTQEFHRFQVITQEFLPNIPLFTTFGNHDFHANHMGDTPNHQARDLFLTDLTERNRLFGMTYRFFDTYTYCVESDEYVIISLQGVDFKNDVYQIGEPMLLWLEQVLTKTTGKLRMIICHYPLTDDNRIYLREDKKLCRLLNRHKNILFISGHLHDTLNFDHPICRQQGTVIYLNDSSVGNATPCAKEVKALRPYRDKARYPWLEHVFTAGNMGLRIEAYDEYVRVRGIDFSSGKYIPRCNFAFGISAMLAPGV